MRVGVSTFRIRISEIYGANMQSISYHSRYIVVTYLQFGCMYLSLTYDTYVITHDLLFSLEGISLNSPIKRSLRISIRKEPVVIILQYIMFNI